MTDLRVEEDLRPQEALVAHIDGELLLADGVDTGVLLDPLGTVRVVFVELFNKIWAHVAEALLQEQDRRTTLFIRKSRMWKYSFLSSKKVDFVFTTTVPPGVCVKKKHEIHLLYHHLFIKIRKNNSEARQTPETHSAAY